LMAVLRFGQTKFFYALRTLCTSSMCKEYSCDGTVEEVTSTLRTARKNGKGVRTRQKGPEALR
jgi:hypothetical protein